MLSQSTYSPDGADELWSSCGENSPDQSCCSSDTGDIFIRSTRVLLSDQRLGAGPGDGSARVTVQRVKEAAVQPPLAEQQRRSSGTEEQRPKARRKPDLSPPVRAAADDQSGKSSGQISDQLYESRSANALIN